jgi:hypothetical protein
MAQPDPGGGGDKEIPITEGIILFLISAFGLGIKTFSKKDKK